MSDVIFEEFLEYFLYFSELGDDFGEFGDINVVFC